MALSCILCTLGEAHGGDDADGDKEIDSKAIIGDLLALGSAETGVMYLTMAKAVRSHMSATVFMFFVLSGSCLCCLYLFFSGVTFSLDIPITDCLVGLLSMRTMCSSFYVALLCNILGTMGFVRAMEYFENMPR